MDDADALVEAYADPLLRRWTRMPVTSPADAHRWLAAQHDGWTTGERFSFAVLDDAGNLLGNVALKRPDPTGERAEVGYWTAAVARGRGVAPAAVRALTSWAFDRFAAEGLHRLELLHQVDNVASCRVAQKAGFRWEATLPPHPPFPREGHLHVRHVADAPEAGPHPVSAMMAG